MTRRKAGLLVFIAVLLVLNAALLYFYFHKEDTLTVTFLNVGQGDAVLIESPTGKDILIDGGPDRAVVRELPKVMGPLDRSIDIVIATHPDKDHIAGLADVFALYSVGMFVESSVDGASSFSEALEAAAGKEKGVMRVTAERGTRIDIGGGAYLDVLFPDRGVDGIETNTGSVIVQLVYGDIEFMLTGDAPSAIEDWLVALDGERLQSDVLKAGHHGSRTSTSELWLAAVDPAFFVVSAGKGNSYGHPHEEVTALVRESGALMRSTVDGPVRFESDGKSVWVK